MSFHAIVAATSFVFRVHAARCAWSTFLIPVQESENPVKRVAFPRKREHLHPREGRVRALLSLFLIHEDAEETAVTLFRLSVKFEAAGFRGNLSLRGIDLLLKHSRWISNVEYRE